MIEVDVCYLLRGHFQKRKTIRYKTLHEAMEIFNATVIRFMKTKQEALVSVRTFKEGKWTLEKIERITL